MELQVALAAMAMRVREMTMEPPTTRATTAGAAMGAATMEEAVVAGHPKVRSNSALVTDACAAALRAFCSAAQRGR